MKRCWLLVGGWLCWVFFALILPPAGYAQTDQDDSAGDLISAEIILDALSPAERIGQLLLVTYDGNRIGPESTITSLITDLHVGGVVLLPEYGNFDPADNTDMPSHFITTTNTLQELALLGTSLSFNSESRADDNLTEFENNVEVGQLPLFIASSYPDHIYLTDGLTQQTSLAAIGATWDREHAFQAGEIYGSELGRIGFNFVLDFPLDILETQDQSLSSRERSDGFGSSPYWVGELGKAYLSGFQTGGKQRIGMITGRFPGSGSSDRPRDLEIPTINKSFEQLQTEELYPFVEVAQSNLLTNTVTGMSIAHIRYQGIQSNITANTVPISLDPNGLEVLLQLDGLNEWRNSGGLLVSEGLGVPAIRRFYNTSGNDFPHRQIAKDALLAGNDILYLKEFATELEIESEIDPQIDTIQDTVNWFLNLYATDPTFQTRVDEAALRIIQAKLRLYGNDLSLTNVRKTHSDLDTDLGQQREQMIGIARNAVSQLYPPPQENSDPLPQISGVDRLVIFTDVRNDQACDNCEVITRLGQTDLEDGILQQYGPDASGQIRPNQLSSFSFGDLIAFLDDDESVPLLTPTPASIVNSPIESTAITETSALTLTLTPSATLPGITRTVTPTPTATPTPLPTPTPIPVKDVIQAELENASWIVIAIEDIAMQTEASNGLKRLLTERPDLIRNKVLVVLSFDLPLYLDSTDISKLTAYYALYSVGDVFEDAAIRLLFRELPLRGSLPIDVPALNYSIAEQTAPDPSQVIGLNLVGDLEPSGSPGPLALTPGDTLRLQTGVIVDRNGNQVPDGTIVTFNQFDRVQGFYSVIAEVPTIGGVATFDYVLEDREGQFRLIAIAGDAESSDTVDIAIETDQEAQVIIATPTNLPTNTPTSSPTATATETPTPTTLPTATQVLVVDPVDPEPSIITITISEIQNFLSMLLGMLAIIFIGGRAQHVPPDKRLRYILWGIITGLSTYLILWYQLPRLDGNVAIAQLGVWRWALSVVLGSTPGLILVWGYNQFRSWLNEEVD